MEDGTTDAAPGTVIGVARDAIQVAAGHQERIAIEQLQLEGGRPLQVRDFLAGHPVETGVRFGGPPALPSAETAP